MKMRTNYGKSALKILNTFEDREPKSVAQVSDEMGGDLKHLVLDGDTLNGFILGMAQDGCLEQRGQGFVLSRRGLVVRENMRNR